MRCDECINVTYCLSHKEDKELIGCTSGVPDCLPDKIASKLVHIVKTGSEKLGFDEEQYFASIVESATKMMRNDKRGGSR